jgi:tetratricopeptide (TPR) repeat protein
MAMAYVLRYAGLLDESARSCDEARRLDPQNPVHRSCAYVALLSGDYEAALERIQVDAGSEFATNFTAELRLRQGRTAEALAEWRRLPADDGRRFFAETCLPGGNAPAGTPTLEDEQLFFSLPDSEPKYGLGALLAYCGRGETALRMLEAAITRNYCAAQALDSDPLWNPVRDDPEFQRLRGLARQCQERFLAHRAAAGG